MLGWLPSRRPPGPQSSSRLLWPVTPLTNAASSGPMRLERPNTKQSPEPCCTAFHAALAAGDVLLVKETPKA